MSIKIFNHFKSLNPLHKKYIPYGKQNITKKDINAVLKVLKSDFITQGPILPKFEDEISKKVNSQYSIAVNSATSALHIACLALGLKENDYLWTSPITFVASANCGRFCGAKIDFVDVDLFTGLISIEALEKKLATAKKENKLPKIIVPVHLAGTSCEMKRIFELSKKYGFSIIEDASHALGGKYGDSPVGSCKYSDITIFSFHPVKIITTGEGGVAVTNKSKLAERMRDLRSHFIIKDEKRFLDKKEGEWKYEMQGLGFNYRMNEIQAALGLSQLKRLEKIINKRNILYKKYQELLANYPINFLKIPINCYSSIHLCIILINKSQNRDIIFSRFLENKIGVQLHYYPVHLQPYYKNLGFKKGDFPSSEEYSSRALSLPLYPELRNNDLYRVSKTLKILLPT